MFAHEIGEQSPIKVYYLYANNDRDKELFQELLTHLKVFERNQRMIGWHPEQLLPGDASRQERLLHLEQARLILLLISPDLIYSDEIYTHDLQIAMERHTQGNAYVVSILLRSGYYTSSPFAHLKVLPDNGKAVTRWSDRDAAYENIAHGLDCILTCLAHKQPVDCSALTLASLEHTESARPTSLRELSFRQRLLRNVHDFWITGVLEQSFYHTANIELALHEQPAALDNPWRFVVQEMKRPERSLPPGTHILTVFDESEGELLILGEPGAGKTTLLLELTRALLTRAEQDQNYPLPAVFNLSSWTQKNFSFSTWLLKELQMRYSIPSNITQQWIKNQQILLLLDGLDEVAPAAYSACIDAINTYHQENDRVPFVICCRHETYFSHETRVMLRNAVTIQPLTQQQIVTYLSSTGALTDLRMLLDQSVELRTLATTPLWLSLLMQVSGTSDSTIHQFTSQITAQSLQQRILALYVECVQTRRAAPPFSPSETEHWLAWLGWQLHSHNQRSFYLERIQPDWLQERRTRVLYYLCMGCIGAIVFALTSALAIALTGWQSWEWMIVSVVSLLGGAGFALASIKIWPVEVLAGSAVKRRIFSLLFSLALWLFVLLRLQANSLLDIIIMLAVTLSLLPLLVAELLKTRQTALSPVSMLIMPGDGLRRSRQNGIWIGLLLGSAIALIVMLLQLVGLFKENFAIVWFLAIVMGLLSGLIFGGLAAIQLSVIHFFLRVTGAIPKNYVDFLNYAVERSLLYKIGASYIFLHPLLQDYLASRYHTSENTDL